MFALQFSIIFLLFFYVHIAFGNFGGFGMGPRPDDFLGAANPGAFQQFQQICLNGNLTKSDVLSQLQNWAQTNGVASQFANATAKLQQRQQDLNSLANANLIGPALQLFNQFYNLLTNNGITRLAECEGLRTARTANSNSSSSNNQQREIERLVPMPPSSIPCPFYPPQCFRNVVPFGMPSRDAVSPDVEIAFVQMPENYKPAPAAFQNAENGENQQK